MDVMVFKKNPMDRMVRLENFLVNLEEMVEMDQRVLVLVLEVVMELVV